MSTPCPAPLQRDFHHEDFRAFLARFSGTADLIVTSPPYVDARTPEAYGVEKAWTAQDDRDLGDSMFAALRPGGTAFVVVGSPVRKWRKGHGTERGLEPVRWLLDLVDRVGFTCRDVLTFGRQGLVGAYTGRFRNDYEPILWLERPGGVPTFDKNPLDRPAVENKRKRTSSGRDATGEIVNIRMRGGDAIERGVARRGTVWDYGNTGKGNSAPETMEATGHPASFPLRTAEDAVACFSKPGDLVLDPFSGRGTTALACARLGRRFAGGDAGVSIKTKRPWAEVAAEVVAQLAPVPAPQPFRIGDQVCVMRHDSDAVAADTNPLPVGSEGKLWRYEPERGTRRWYVCADGEGWGWHSDAELEHV
jgi:hypothetical protein